MTFHDCLNSVFIFSKRSLDCFNNLNKDYNHKRSNSDHHPLSQAQVWNVEEIIKSRNQNRHHKEDKGNWDWPVKGFVFEESNRKDWLVNRLDVKGMEQLDKT